MKKFLQKYETYFFFYNVKLDWYWFPLEYVGKRDGIVFGFVVGDFPEFGDFSLHEIFSIGGTVGGAFEKARKLDELVEIVEKGGILEADADIYLDEFIKVTRSKASLQEYLETLPNSKVTFNEIEKDEENKKELSLKDFLNEFGDTLKEKVLKKLNPIYNPAQIGEWEKKENHKLNKLLRKPFNAQRHAILALAKGFYKENKKSLILTAEMGTGKTIMGMSVAYLNPKKNKRTLVVCPPHLAEKWVREIKETIPNAKVKVLRSISDIDKSKPQGIEYWVLKNTTAKLHYSVKYVKRLNDNDTLNKCPDCGVELSIDNVIGNTMPKCAVCKTPLYYADKDRFRRYGLAEYIKRKKIRIDFLILDEVHELKGGDTAVGQAMANLVSVADKTLAMTGTLMGGYAKNLFYILFRMFTKRFIEKGYTHSSVTSFERNYGVIEETRVYVKDSGRSSSIGARLKSVKVHSKPGMSPGLLPEFILDSTYFMKLSDVSDQLPEYSEYLIGVEMDELQYDIYKHFENSLVDEVKRLLVVGSTRLLGAMVNSLYALPDGARRGEIAIDPATKEEIAVAPPIDLYMLPKEKKLIELIMKEKQKNRKCAIFLEHTGTRDLIPDLVERLENNGIKTLVLRSGSPATDKREAWIKRKLKENPDTDVLICNPNLVKTGLDLLDFPTIIFFQTGYNIYTLRQASRRSWRIGQKQPVRVYYMYYNDTMQERAMKLIATKMETSLAVEGDLSENGLTSLSEGESMTIQMAKALVDGDKDNKKLEDIFSSYREKDMTTDLELDETYEIVNLTEIERKEIKTSKGKTRTIETGIETVIEKAWENAKKKEVGNYTLEYVTIDDLLKALEIEEVA
ncbi:DEAD/DEAH box helicase [Deferribacter autotrophicus]|nr:DEAD/DEAH box helicase [Deferribacter autotrophicus]